MAESKAKVAIVELPGGTTREYSEEVHGKDFGKLAAMYAKKCGGKVAK